MNQPVFSRQHLHAALSGVGATLRHDPFDELAAAYGSADRHYHDVRHIAECLAILEAHRDLAERPAEVAVALWFHDAIYDPRRPDNEERSAAWARSYLAGEGVTADVAERVVALILATKTHVASEPDALLLVDIDLAILGATAERFDAYDAAVRREYHWVGDAEFRAGRAAVLQGFLEREAIYRTPVLRAAYEAQARANLQRKLRDLEV